MTLQWKDHFKAILTRHLIENSEVSDKAQKERWFQPRRSLSVPEMFAILNFLGGQMGYRIMAIIVRTPPACRKGQVVYHWSSMQTTSKHWSALGLQLLGELQYGLVWKKYFKHGVHILLTPWEQVLFRLTSVQWKPNTCPLWSHATELKSSASSQVCLRLQP